MGPALEEEGPSMLEPPEVVEPEEVALDLEAVEQVGDLPDLPARVHRALEQNHQVHIAVIIGISPSLGTVKAHPFQPLSVVLDQPPFERRE